MDNDDKKSEMQDKLLRESFQHMMSRYEAPDFTTAVMSRVSSPFIRHRLTLWLVKHAAVLGLMIFVAGLVVAVLAVTSISQLEFSITLPAVSEAAALWGIPIAVLITLGVWQMETA